MKNPEVQIMFYGKNIGQHDVSVSNNVVISNVTKTENPNYVFVTINTQNVAPGELTFSFKTKNKTAFTKNTNSNHAGKIRPCAKVSIRPT